MTKVSVLSQTGASVGEIELNDAIFGIEPNEAVLFDAVVAQRASLRQGNHKVKNRSEVAGGGRKPWRQKGTGPTPRSYSYKLPKKVRRLALKSALSAKVVEQNFLVLDALTLAAPKTKEFTKILKDLSLEKKSLFVTADLDENVALSARNIPGVTVLTANGINVLDLLGHDKVVFTKSAVEKVEEVLG